MDGQLSFATLDYVGKKKRTKRDVFLAEMAAAVPWSVLEAVIAPHYPKEGPQGGRRAFPIAVMLRIYCLQQWYDLSDPGAEEALYDIQSMRAFCNLELGRDPIPDETTILNFRHLLEAHELTKTVFEAVAEYFIGTILTEDAPSSVRPRRASAVQPPDRDVENARESNPDRERHETPSRHPIEPINPTTVARMTRNCGIMLITPSSGLLAPKNIHDHAALSTS